MLATMALACLAAWSEPPMSAADASKVTADASRAHRVSVCAPVDAAPGRATTPSRRSASTRCASARSRSAGRAEQIVVIDSDQGQSGASAADREGFQRLVAEVGLGQAGIVLGLEVSRLARNNADWHRLLEICALTRHADLRRGRPL